MLKAKGGGFYLEYFIVHISSILFNLFFLMTTTTSSLLYFTNVRYIHCIPSWRCVSKLAGRIGVEENLFVLTSEMGAVLFFVSKDRFLRLPIYGLGFNLINAFVGFVFSLYWLNHLSLNYDFLLAVTNSFVILRVLYRGGKNKINLGQLFRLYQVSFLVDANEKLYTIRCYTHCVCRQKWFVV